MTQIDSKKDMLVKIVTAYAKRPEVTPEHLLGLVDTLAEVLSVDQDTSIPAPKAEAGSEPAIPISKAVTDEKVYCLCCGKGFRMLKRHIGAEHGLTEAQYRNKFGLPEDFPLVAPSYSEMKASFAKKAGLGKYARQHEGVND